MIDLHTHLLPGVDDGSPSVEVSVGVLQRFASEGVEVVVCTPHLDASFAASAPHERHAAILEVLRASAPPTPLLALGWEIMLDAPGIDLTDARLGLGGSSAVLVEFPRTAVPPNSSRELHRLRASGIVPVLAHPERYWGCTPQQVDEWRRAGAVIQMDAAGLLGGSRMSRVAVELLEQGLVDPVSSDTHGDARSMLPARRWLEEVGGEEIARLLTRENPARLLRGERVIPAPPLPRRRGMVQRLRELVFGHS
jgi:protein-tyrosine phosphatase